MTREKEIPSPQSGALGQHTISSTKLLHSRRVFLFVKDKKLPQISFFFKSFLKKKKNKKPELDVWYHVGSDGT
jgi:hypothetical protein